MIENYDTTYTALRIPAIAVRTPLLPVRIISDLMAEPDPILALRALLRSDPLIRQGIVVASPSLAKAMDAWLGDEPLRNKKAPLRLLAYVNRMASRATPLGICAGIGMADIGPTTTLELQTEARTTVTRPDMDLIWSLAKVLEAGKHRRRIRYVCSDAIVDRGDRIFITNVRLASYRDAMPEQRSVTLRNTPAVAFIRDLAVEATEYGVLLSALMQKFEATESEVERTLNALIEAGLLLSELSLPPIENPVREFLERCSRIDPDLARSLHECLRSARALDAEPLHQRNNKMYEMVRTGFSSLVESKSENVIQVDMRAPLSGVVGTDLLRDAATMLEYLLRLGRVMGLDAFRERFISRYEGRERMVALLTLLDEDLGIGSSGDLEARNTAIAGRDEFMSSLAFKALMSDVTEVHLSPLDIETLSEPNSDFEFPDSFEIGFQVAAADIASIARGEYLLVPGSFHGAMRAGRSLGRFVHLFPESEQARIRQIAREGVPEGPIAAELVFVPLSTRLCNVTIRPSFYDFEIRVATPKSGHAVIPLEDLWVGLDERQRFFLWSKTHKRCVLPIETHLLNTPRKSPNICRFLSCVGDDGRRAIRGFDWGPAWALPALPRVRIGRIVLSLARWRIPTREIVGSISATQTAIDQWRSSWKMTRYVYLQQGDNRLLLDLDSPIAASLFWDQLDRSRPYAELVEALPSPDDAWLAGADGHYIPEFAVSMLRSELPLANETPAPIVVQSRKQWGPFSDWTYIKLYMPLQAMDDFLLRRIAPLTLNLRNAFGVDKWFYIRYADPERHLRVRFHCRDATLAREELLRRAEEWLQHGHVLRYALDTYDPEYERYGGLDEMDAVERFFTADSDTCLTSLAGLGNTADARVARAVATFLPFLAGEERLPELASSALRVGRSKGLSRSDRESLRHLVEIFDGVQSVPILGSLLAAQKPEERFLTFFHLHCNRTGVTQEAEARAIALLRAVLVSRSARRRTSKPSRDAAPVIV